MSPTSPGYQTTEFWQSLITSVIGLLIEMGVVHSTNPDLLVQALTNIAGALLIIVPNALYILGRNKLKSQVLQTATPVLHVTTTTPTSAAENPENLPAT
jgi:hypothetical protein